MQRSVVKECIKTPEECLFKIVDKNGKRHVALFLTIKMALLLTIKIKDSNFIFNACMIHRMVKKKEREKLKRSQSS